MTMTVEHQGRELLHAIDMLSRCLQIPKASRRKRDGWERDLVGARRDLESLFVGGLRRDFVSQAAGTGARPAP